MNWDLSKKSRTRIAGWKANHDRKKLEKRAGMPSKLLTWRWGINCCFRILIRSIWGFRYPPFAFQASDFANASTGQDGGQAGFSVQTSRRSRRRPRKAEVREEDREGKLREILEQA